MLRVIVESPYAGDIERNTLYARRAVRDCLERGEAPIASHLLFPQAGILNEFVPEERSWGIAAGLMWLPVADLVALYIDYGVSNGMKGALTQAEHLGKRVQYRRIGENP